jgi:3-oxoadipate enol-lactonase
MEEEIRTIAVDLPGCGFSPAPAEGFSFEVSVEILRELIEEVIEEEVAVLGHSMGTIIALKLAYLTPLVNKLIFVGGLPRPNAVARRRLRDRAVQVRRGGMAGIGDLTMPVIFSRRSLDQHPDKVALYHRLLELNDPTEYACAADRLADASAEDVFRQVQCRSLALTGSEDKYAPPAEVMKFAREISARYEEIPDCGHMPFFEDPDRFNSIIRSFLVNRENS